jgi:hypothetical protein
MLNPGLLPNQIDPIEKAQHTTAQKIKDGRDSGRRHESRHDKTAGTVTLRPEKMQVPFWPIIRKVGSVDAKAPQEGRREESLDTERQSKGVLHPGT